MAEIPPLQGPPPIKPLRDAVLAVASILTVAAVGLAYTYWQARQALTGAVQSELLQLARTAATQIDGDRHRLLNAPAQEGGALHREVLAPLTRFHRAAKDVIYIYTAIERDGRIYFILDTGLATEYGWDTTPPDPIMTEYQGTDTALRRALRERVEAVNATPVREKLRAYMSAYVPFYDKSGSMAGVVGVDLWVRDLESRLAVIGYSTLAAFALSLLLSLIAALAVYRLRLQAAVAQAGEHQAVVAALAAQAAAEAANHAKTRFFANMSHELRTPLNGVIGLADLMLHEPLSADGRRYANLLRHAGNDMLSLVNDILDMTRLEAGALMIAPQEFDLHDMIASCCAIHAEAARAKGLDWVLTIDPLVPRRVISDPMRIGQVINNLLGNAVKFTSAGAIKVMLVPDAQTPVVAAADGATDQSWIKFRVVDSGIGIAADTIPKLFQRFAQADASNARRYGGAGLGLAICRELVMMLGGRIAVESVPGQGSEFWFTLPLATAAPTASN